MFKQVFVKEMKPSLQHDAGSCIIWEGCGTHHWRYHSPTVRRWCTTNPNNRTSTLSVFFPQKISGEETKFQIKFQLNFACATTIKWNLAIMVAVTPPICTFCLKKKINKRNKILFPAFPHLYQNTSFSTHGSLTRDYATKGHQQVFAKSSSALFS